ncbi:MAG TPA: hypothetical protein VMD92_11410 [Acidobacteriaceae bacterium]|nr:hypothetical protein [Acidobacteriaceae bacterium]
MLALGFYPWLRFGLGILAGCWIGSAVGLGIALMLAGRRIQQLEEINLMLRAKLRARDKERQSGPAGVGPVLVFPPGVNRPASSPLGRVAGGR